MGRVAPLAAALVAAWAGAAWAGPMHRIRVETKPAGAHVYLGDKESGPKCDATPCEFDAPVGDDVLIIELEGHDPLLQPIEVKRSRDRKAQVFTFELTASVARIVVDDPRAKGATIQIDGEDKGKAPAKIDVDPGGHKVTVKLGGTTLFDDFVDVEDGSELPIQITAAAAAGQGDGDGSAGDGGDGSEGSGSGSGSDDGGDTHTGSGDEGGSIHKPAVATAPRERFIRAQGVMDVGWRVFHYEHYAPGLPPREEEDGQVIAGPALELWPAELLHAQHLRGLSLYLRAEFPINSLDVKDVQTGMPVAATSWSSFEASLHQRWTGDSVAVEVGAGYVRDQMQYSGPGVDSTMLPSADYQSLMIGGRLLFHAGPLQPYLAAETRIVLSGGGLMDNFRNASATGLRGAVGIEATFGGIYARVEASDLHYTWSYPSDVSPPQPATGASDKVFGFSVTAGYQY